MTSSTTIRVVDSSGMETSKHRPAAEADSIDKQTMPVRPLRP